MMKSSFKIGDKICPKYSTGRSVYEIVAHSGYDYKVKYPDGRINPWSISVTDEIYILKELLNTPLIQALEEEE